jgi:hypothetical protein
MYSNLLLDIYDSFRGFFEAITGAISLGTIMTIALAVFATIVFVSVISTSFSIEIRTNRAVNKINNYLDKKPFVNEENLVEFNNLMKSIPKPMRYEWQQYMLNREELPSKFMTQHNCVERPFKSSSYEQSIIYAKNVITIFTALFLVLGLSELRTLDTQVAGMLFQISVIPTVFFVLGTVLIMFLRARRKAVVTDLYYNFDYMTSSLDKAIETMPAFVDYEILFSRKEIKQGIPALQDYLEKRALYEQEQLERAKAGAVEHDKYDFSALEISGSLVMERAMREAEYYLGNRSRLLVEIEQLESEKDSHGRAYSEATKTLQRKLRDIKENLERLRDALANATNKIDSNYIRKQQADEIKKQQTLEKEVAAITNRYNKDIATIDEEIAKRNREIEEQRGYLEKAMSGEFNEFSKKAYEQLNELVEEKNKGLVEVLKREKRALEEELDTANTIMVEKEVLFKEKLEAMSKQEEILRKKDEEIALKEEFIKGQNARIKELAAGKVIQRYFDANGNEFFYDEEGNPYYRDASGNIIYYDSESEEDEVEEELEPAREEALKHKAQAKTRNNAISKSKLKSNSNSTATKPKTTTKK